MATAAQRAQTAIIEFVGVTKFLRLFDLALDGEIVTDLTAGVAVTYKLLDGPGGVELTSGVLTYVTKPVGTPPVSTSFWEAQIATPDIPDQVCHVHWEATKGLSSKKWHGTIRVKAFA